MNDFNLPSRILEKAVNELAKLPGVGQKTALRLALHLLRQKKEEAIQLGIALTDLVENIQYCRECHNITESDLCLICSNPQRDHATICIVEDIRDMMAVENTLRYQGVYHILGGIISPIHGIGPQDLTIELLAQRIAEKPVKELIFALPTTMEGDTTAYYLYRRFRDFVPLISTLARGIAFGDQLQYIDEITLGNSLTARVPFHE